MPKLEKLENVSDVSPYLENGDTRQGEMWFGKPQVGIRFHIGTLSTSPVTEILEETEEKIKFRTLNSIYLLTL